MEDRAIEQINFSSLKSVCIISSSWFEMDEVRYLTPKFLRRRSQSLGRGATPLPLAKRNEGHGGYVV
jgi:hypothetical protein